MGTSGRLHKVPMAFNVVNINGVLMAKVHEAMAMLCDNDAQVQRKGGFPLLVLLQLLMESTTLMP